METILLILSVIIISFIASIYKVEEALYKHNFRQTVNNNFSFLSTKGYMQFTVFFIASPILFYIEWDLYIFSLIIVLSFGRFLFWVLVNKARGNYKDALHQSSSNFTMLENFAGPIGALLVFGIFNYFINSHVSLFWYILTPFIGLFLLWALREEKGKLSKEMITIILLQALLVAVETSILFYIKNITITFITFPKIEFLPFLNEEMFLFLIIIAISSLFCGLYFIKDIIYDAKQGTTTDGLRIGLISGVHDIFYFMGFMFFGPIFLIARRGLLVPVQNLYINIKDNKNISSLLINIIKKPLLSLNGGKDFIISFVDIVFNQTVKVIIKILS